MSITPDFKKSILHWLIIATVILLADQASKQYILHNFNYAERLNLLPFFDLTLLFNTGAAFSFLADSGGYQRWLFTLIAIAAIALIIYWLYKYRQQRLFCLALIFILAGALGNLIDRIYYGHVIDFLLFYWRDWYFPAFNIADSAITCGAAVLIFEEIFKGKKPDT